MGLSLPSPRPTQNSSTPPCLSLSLSLSACLFNQKLASNTQPQSVILTLWRLLLLWCQNCVSLLCTITTSTIQSSDTKAKVSLALHHHPIFQYCHQFLVKKFMIEISFGHLRSIIAFAVFNFGVCYPN